MHKSKKELVSKNAVYYNSQVENEDEFEKFFDFFQDFRKNNYLLGGNNSNRTSRTSITITNNDNNANNNLKDNEKIGSSISNTML